MFTGIIEAVGALRRLVPVGGDLRFEIDAGDILLDGVSIRDYSLSNLRDNISLVSQDVVLFDDTIANNLAYGELRAHSREEPQTEISRSS